MIWWFADDCFWFVFIVSCFYHMLESTLKHSRNKVITMIVIYVLLAAEQNSEWLLEVTSVLKVSGPIPRSQSSLRSCTLLSSSLPFPLLLLDAPLTRPYLLTMHLHVFPTCLPDVVIVAAFTCLPPLAACCQQRVRYLPWAGTCVLIDFHPRTFVRWRCSDSRGNRFHLVNVTTKVKVCDGEMLRYCLFFVSYQPQKGY